MNMTYKSALLFLGILTASSLLAASPTFAQGNPQSATDSATQEATTSATTQNLRERIERVVDEKREQIQGVLTDLDQRRRGVIGQVERITEESITISNHKGTEIIPLKVDQVPVRLIKAGNEIELTDIAVGDWILSLGLMEDNSFIPNRILVSSNSLRPTTRSVAIGAIVEVTTSNLSIDQRAGDTITFVTNRNTTYQDLEGEEITRTQLTNLAENTQALVAGSISNGDDNESVRTARLIRVLTIIGN